MRTRSSPSVISSSAIPDSWTRSISFLSLRRSISQPPSAQVLERVLQRQLVAPGPQAANHPDRLVGKERMMAERLARKDIRQVHFDERNLDRRQSIAQGHAGMGERRRIDQNEARP